MITGLSEEPCRLVAAYQNAAFRLAFSILHDEADAEDALQDAMVSAYLKYSTFRGVSFRSWFLTIVRNRCYDELRHKGSHPVTSLDYNYNTRENADFLEAASFRAQKSLSPEQWVEQQEAVEAVCRCVDRLPADYRKAVILVDIQGMDYSEAAQALGRPVGTVKSRLARGRAQVLQMLSLPPAASFTTARFKAAAMTGKKTFFRDQLDTLEYPAKRNP
jgi:RNA polymerase sigma-70 factor (ECF subfamily)